MSNPWLTPRRASALSPPSLAAGDDRNPIPPLPPDPPDLGQYPPLSPSSTKTILARNSSPKTVVSVKGTSTSTVGSAEAKSTLKPKIIGSEGKTGSVASGSEKTSPQQFTILKPKKSSPLQTNRAASPPSQISTHSPPSEETSTRTTQPEQTETSDILMAEAPLPASVTPPPTVNVSPAAQQEPQKSFVQQMPQNSSTQQTPSLVEKIRRLEDKSLTRLAPVSFAENGRPRVLIPDEVFQIGVDLHKDFTVCYFKGRPPPYSQIQSVLNHIKGKRLEIHNNPNTRSVLVRITSDWLKQKIFEKGIWYVGDFMFHTAQWNSAHSNQSPSMQSIQIWAHLHGVPLDLRHQKGLSLVAGLVGEPKETDDFTKNLVSLTLSHVKVEVDLTGPLPSVVEFSRQSGEVVEVLVTYPWLPPTCAHCKELGHIQKNCLLIPLATKDPAHKVQTPAQKDKQQEERTDPTMANAAKNKAPKTPQGAVKQVYKAKSPSPRKFTPTSSLAGSASLEAVPPTSALAPTGPFTLNLASSESVIPPPSTLPSLPPPGPPKHNSTPSSPLTLALPSLFKPDNPSFHFTPEPLQKPALKKSRSNPSIDSTIQTSPTSQSSPSSSFVVPVPSNLLKPQTLFLL